MQIKIDRTKCVGTTACIDNAPSVFELDSQSIAKIKDGFDITKADAETKQKIIEAAKSCPTLALTAIDDAGKQIWPAPGAKAK